MIIDFFLYRIKLIFPKDIQNNLFCNISDRSKTLLKAIRNKPSDELRKGQHWHIGNIEMLDEYGGYFAVGRTTKSIVEKYDDSTGDFTEESLETSPYTHVLFDTKLSLISIAKKSKLSPNAGGIARKISQLISKTDIIRQHKIGIEAGPISDPNDFIEMLAHAYSIQSFEVTFSRPNPFDADEYFQKPMERYLHETNGTKGKTIIKGKDLDAEALIDVSKSVASTGNDAKARIEIEAGSPLITKSLKDNPAHMKISDDKFDKKEALLKSRKLYIHIRGENDRS